MYVCVRVNSIYSILDYRFTCKYDKVIARSQTSPILQVHVCGLYNLCNFYQNIYLMSKRERMKQKLCYKREREKYIEREKQ